MSGICDLVFKSETADFINRFIKGGKKYEVYTNVSEVYLPDDNRNAIAAAYQWCKGDKSTNIIEKTKSIYCENKNNNTADLIARMYFESRKFEDALYWFRLSGSCTGEYMCISSQKERMLKADKAIREGYATNVIIYDYTRVMKKTGNIKQLMDTFSSVEFDVESDICFFVFSALLAYIDANNKYIDWKDKNIFFCEENFVFMQNAVIDYFNINQEYRSVRKDKAESIIISFDSKKLYGFIKESPRNLFFYIEQVKDERLMNMLLEKPFEPYRVSYCHSKNYKGRRVASQICLCDKIDKKVHKGNIVSYDAQNGFGYIKSEGISYSFIYESIADLFLKVYLKSHSHNNIEVKFYTDKLGKKDIAVYIHSGKVFSQSDIDFLLSEKIITQNDIDVWNDFCKNGAVFVENGKVEEKYLHEAKIKYVELKSFL